MPGYIIHIAVANRYYQKHKSQILDYNSFIEGVINPDLVKKFEKNSHKITYDKSFLTDFDLGEIIHIATDKCFYRLFKWNGGFYKDYDRTNKYLIQKYKIKIPKEIFNDITYLNESPKNFTTKQLDSFIESMSNVDILDCYKNKSINKIELKNLQFISNQTNKNELEK